MSRLRARSGRSKLTEFPRAMRRRDCYERFLCAVNIHRFLRSRLVYPESCCCLRPRTSSFWSRSSCSTGPSRGSVCWRLSLILFANYFFYAKWDLFYLALIPAVSSCDFFIGLGLQNSNRTLVRRLLVTASIVMNIGMLVAFKYMPFFLQNWAAVTGRPAPEWHWTLPLSLSFYVFQALTYTSTCIAATPRAPGATWPIWPRFPFFRPPSPGRSRECLR